MRNFIKGLAFALALCAICSVSLVDASPRIKATSLFPYTSTTQEIPLYDPNYVEESCTTEIINDECSFEGYVPSVYIPSANEYTPSSNEYTPSSHSFVPAFISEGSGGVYVPSTYTQETCTLGEGKGKVIAYRRGSSDNWEIPLDGEIPKRCYDETYDTAKQSIHKPENKCEMWVLYDSQQELLYTPSTYTVETYVAGTCGRLVQAVDSYTPSSNVYVPSSNKYIASGYNPEVVGQLVHTNAQATISCPEIDDPNIPKRSVTLDQLVTTACPGETINIRGGGYIWREKPSDVVQSRFTVVYQAPGKAKKVRLIIEDRDLADVQDGEFTEERTFTFELPGTYTIRYWIYNKGTPVSLAKERIIEVPEACEQNN